jgi:hypothetical protein
VIATDWLPPPAIEPETGLKVSHGSVAVTDQFRVVVADPVFPTMTDWVKFALLPCVAEKLRDGGGEIERTGAVTPGVSNIVALADFVGSAALVAVTCTDCAFPMEVGAV